MKRKKPKFEIGDIIERQGYFLKGPITDIKNGKYYIEFEVGCSLRLSFGYCEKFYDLDSRAAVEKEFNSDLKALLNGGLK